MRDEAKQDEGVKVDKAMCDTGNSLYPVVRNSKRYCIVWLWNIGRGHFFAKLISPSHLTGRRKTKLVN